MTMEILIVSAGFVGFAGEGSIFGGDVGPEVGTIGPGGGIWVGFVSF